MTRRILFVDTPSSRQLRDDAEAVCRKINDHIHTRTAQLLAEGKLDANGRMMAERLPDLSASSHLAPTERKRP